MTDDRRHPSSAYDNEDEGEWNDQVSLQKLRAILNVAQRAYDPEFSPDDPVDSTDPGRSVLWADTINPVSGAYRRNKLRELGDSLACSIIEVIHDAFVMERRERVALGIIEELRKDRERIACVLAVLDLDRTWFQDQ